jgi:hypothetical protein
MVFLLDCYTKNVVASKLYDDVRPTKHNFSGALKGKQFLLH